MMRETDIQTAGKSRVPVAPDIIVVILGVGSGDTARGISEALIAGASGG
jgi:hypothetical protein